MLSNLLFLAGTAQGTLTPRPGHAPVVEIQSPETGAIVSGTVPIVVEAASAQSVARVLCKVDSTYIGIIKGDLGTYTFYWDTTLFPEGERYVQVLAMDPAGKRMVDRAWYTVVREDPNDE